MDEDLNKPPEPVVQPVSVHETPHKHHGALPLITAMLGVFLVLALVALGYVTTKYVVVSDSDSNEIEQVIEEEVDEEVIDEDAERESRTTPTIEARASTEGGRVNEIVMYSSSNDRSKVVYTAPEPMSIGEVIVPQKGFDGRIFFTLMGEGDLPTLLLNELDVSEPGSEPTIPEFVDELPFTGTTATAFSPDQTHIAAVYYNPDFDETSGEVIFWNLLTGERTVEGDLEDGLAFTPTIHGFAGADGFDLEWTEPQCLGTPVYTLSATGNDNVFLEMRGYGQCSLGFTNQ